MATKSQAFIDAQKKVGENPSSSEAHAELGAVLKDEGQYTEALAAYDESLKHDGTNAAAIQGQKDVYAVMDAAKGHQT